MAPVVVAPVDVVFGGSKVPVYACVFALRTFFNEDGDIIPAGDPSKMSGGYYRRADVSVTGNVATVGVFTGANAIDPTYDTVTGNNKSEYVLGLYTSSGGLVQLLFQNIRVPDTPNPTTWEALDLFSNAVNQPMTRAYFDSYQVMQLLEPGIIPGDAFWGGVDGLISDQADLQAALDAKQTADADLTTIAGLGPADDDVLQRKGGVWVNRSMTQLAIDIVPELPPSGGLGDMDAATYDPGNVNADVFDRGNHTGEQAISTVTNLQDELDAKALVSPLARHITGLTDSITQADNGKILRADNPLAQLLTVTNPLAVGFNCLIIQEDAGQTTFDNDGTVSILNRQGHDSIAGERGLASLVCPIANTVILAGDTALASVTGDSDLEAFLTATGITDPTIEGALSDLIASMKDDGLWTKLLGHAVHPMVGASADTHKYNLMAPTDTDADFRVTWAGGLTHDVNGVTGNGTTGYGDTHYNPSTELPADDGSFGIYIQDNTSGASAEFGSFVGSGEGFFLATNFAGSFYLAGNGAQDSQLAGAAGFHQVSRIDSGFQNYKVANGAATFSVSAYNAPSFTTYVCARNNSGAAELFSGRTVSFLYQGPIFDAAELTAFYTHVQAFMVALGRDV